VDGQKTSITLLRRLPREHAEWKLLRKWCRMKGFELIVARKEAGIEWTSCGRCIGI
jgi:hypothetical protein